MYVPAAPKNKTTDQKGNQNSNSISPNTELKSRTSKIDQQFRTSKDIGSSFAPVAEVGNHTYKVYIKFCHVENKAKKFNMENKKSQELIV